MNMLNRDEQEIFATASPASLQAVGVLLLAGTLFADFYAVRDFVWISERIRLQYVEPVLSGAVLAATPWLVLLSYRLITRAYEHRDLFSPLALILLGFGFVGAGVLGWRSGFFGSEFVAGKGLIGILALGAGAVSLGWYRARRRQPQ
jgi:hypothetical protein